MDWKSLSNNIILYTEGLAKVTTAPAIGAVPKDPDMIGHWT
jgi:hypothetical protein